MNKEKQVFEKWFCNNFKWAIKYSNIEEVFIKVENPLSEYDVYEADSINLAYAVYKKLILESEQGK